MAAILLIIIIFVFYWQIRRFRGGGISKKKAIGLYVVYAIMPVVLYGSVFMDLVGIEELTNTAIISEGYARSLLFVIAGGLAVVVITTIVFSIVLFFINTEGES